MERYNDKVGKEYVWIKQATWGEYYHAEIMRSRDHIRSNLWMSRQAYALWKDEKEFKWFKMYLECVERAMQWKKDLEEDKQRANEIDRTR